MKKQVTNLRGSQLELSREFRKWNQRSRIDQDTVEADEDDVQGLLSPMGRGSCGGETFLLSPFQLEELGKAPYVCCFIRAHTNLFRYILIYSDTNTDFIVNATEDCTVYLAGVRIDQGFFFTIISLLFTNFVSIISRATADQQTVEG